MGYLQFTDSAGILHEISAPIFCQGASVTGTVTLPGSYLLQLSTSCGAYAIQMPPEFSPDAGWVITGYRM